jgi:FAD/FMN-containing dehydrogenase
MSCNKNDRTTRRNFVKHVAVGATGLAASSSSDFILAASDPVVRENRPNEYDDLIKTASNFKELLSKVLKDGRIVSDPAVLDGYAKDCSFVAPGMPLFLVRPETREEVQQVIKLANKSRMPLIPVSSGPPRFHGDTVPSQGAAIVDLTGMNRTMKIDPINRCATVEAGVSYGQLCGELKKSGSRLNLPLLPRSSKSVVASRLEREPTLMPKYQFDYIDPVLALEVIYGTGDDFRTGSASGPGALETLRTDKVNPWGPGSIDYCKFLSGAQGTMGLVTWATTKLEVRPVLQKIYFIPVKAADHLSAPIIRILRQRVADECLALNNVNLAAMLAESWPADFEELKKKLPPWTIIVCVSGYARRPEERLSIYEGYLKSICRDLGLRAQTALSGAEGKEKAVLELLSGPWETEPYWKLRPKGSCHDIFFLTTLSKAPGFIEIMKKIAGKHRYFGNEIGVYLQPMVQGRGCHCEFNLFCDESNAKEVAEARKLFMDASKILMENGAFFSRPYAPWADLVYSRFAEGVATLRKLKNIFDPNNILNPGKLCF